LSQSVIHNSAKHTLFTKLNDSVGTNYEA
jgi:hypothetical protein